MTENDDFDGPNAPFEDEHEFQESASSGGFVEAWKNSPLLKIMTLGAGLVVVIGLIAFMGGDEDVSNSRLRPASQVNEAPGAEVDEQYEEAIQQADRQRLEEAIREQSSVLPTPRGSLRSRLGDEEEEEQAKEDEDPLAQWRRRAEQRERERQKEREARTKQRQTTSLIQQKQQQQQALMPDQQNIALLSESMASQMQSILETRKLRGSQNIVITTPGYLSNIEGAGDYDGSFGQNSNFGAGQQGGGFSGDGSVGDDVVVENIIIPAGEIFYGQLITEANSDVEGPILGMIYQGPLRGSKLLGSFSTTGNDQLVLEFDTLIVDGIDYSISAVAVDPKTTSTGMATEVDRHLLTRVILPGAASFIQGIADAYAERENNVSVSGDVVVSQTEPLNTRGKVATGIAESAGEISEFLDDEASRYEEPTVIVHAGTPMGILFIEPVVE